MCYGSLDPKLSLRETEARMKGVAAFGGQGKPVAAGQVVSVISGLRALLQSWMRRDAVVSQTVSDVLRGR